MTVQYEGQRADLGRPTPKPHVGRNLDVMSGSLTREAPGFEHYRGALPTAKEAVCAVRPQV